MEAPTFWGILGGVFGAMTACLVAVIVGVVAHNDLCALTGGLTMLATVAFLLGLFWWTRPAGHPVHWTSPSYSSPATPFPF